MKNMYEEYSTAGGKGGPMKKLWFVTALSALVMAPAFIAWAGGFELRGEAGPYKIDVKMDRNPPVKGHNGIDITVSDKASRPVTDAEVEIEYLMPSLPGRPPMMDYNTKAKLTGNKYHGSVNLSMAGKWTVVVKVIRGGKGETVGFTFVVE